MISITAPTNDVTANAYYSTNGGSSYTAGDTGGTVKAGSAEAGASSICSVKYKSTVSLVAMISAFIFKPMVSPAGKADRIFM